MDYALCKYLLMFIIPITESLWLLKELTPPCTAAILRMSVSIYHVFIGLLSITCISCQKWFNITEEFMVIPNNNGSRVVVKLQLELSQVIADAMAMSVEMHHSMNLRWQDDRFIRQGSTDPHKTYINMYGTDPDFEFIWVPDVYMTNEVPSGILDYQPTDIIRIYENGTLLLSKQHVVMFYCKLRLFKVPMTNEICSIQFQSNAYNAYSEEEMDLDWFYNPPVTFSKDYVSLVSKISNTMTEKCEGGEISPND
ncbi:gamma-aminobutyric acid receptor subunit rho-3-like [Mytilus galloprovincialis]|uniref:gamma-aminobutyric acid receptor subunit rho-3-like n=1 Tax=Mytilus galloprovincialis TaxID=29158 RepID=UPI003F7C0791